MSERDITQVGNTLYDLREMVARTARLESRVAELERSTLGHATGAEHERIIERLAELERGRDALIARVDRVDESVATIKEAPCPKDETTDGARDAGPRSGAGQAPPPAGGYAQRTALGHEAGGNTDPLAEAIRAYWLARSATESTAPTELATAADRLAAEAEKAMQERVEWRAEVEEYSQAADHWRVKAECYGAMVRGCQPALEKAGFRVDAGQPGGAVKGIADAVTALAQKAEKAEAERDEARAEPAKAAPPNDPARALAECLKEHRVAREAWEKCRHTGRPGFNYNCDEQSEAMVAGCVVADAASALLERHLEVVKERDEARAEPAEAWDLRSKALRERDAMRVERDEARRLLAVERKSVDEMRAWWANGPSSPSTIAWCRAVDERRKEEAT